MNVTDEKLSVAIKAVAVRFGYAELKPCQEKAVKSFVSGNALFLSLPILDHFVMYLSRSALVFYILKDKQSRPYSILFSKAEPFLIISIFYVISTSDNQHTNVQIFLY